MLYIITGEINSGKSTYLKKIYLMNGVGDGFYNRKLFSGATYIGQEILRLSDEVALPFSYRLDHLPEQWDELYSYRDYSFSRKGLDYCKEIIDDSLKSPLPCYIDEIGPLELLELGLYQDFKRVLQTEKDIYVVIRDRCLPEVLSKFKIDHYRILKSE